AGWLYRRKGASAATAGAGLIAFCPSVVAHVSLAGTDACFALFGTLALAAIAGHFHRPSPWRFGLMALAIAAGMAAKYSGVFLLPVAAVMYLVQPPRPAADRARMPWIKRCRRAARDGALLVLLTATFWWGLHLFSFTGPLKNYPLEKTPDSSPWVQMLGRGPVATEAMRIAHEKLKRPAPLAGVLFQYLHNRRGHSAFLLGRRSETGWWHYFPFAFLAKSTPVELLLCGALAVLVARRLPAPWRAFKALDTQVQSLLIGAAVFSLLVVSARINIGQRYLLLLYPLLVLLAVDRLWERMRRRPRLGGSCAAALVAAQAASCLSVAPHYLAYFNRAAGGPERGWHLLVDSNIDWGQDLPGLGRELERGDRRRVALAYFGTAAPRAYGVEADNVPALKRPLDEYDTLALSVTALQGLYVLADDPFREFRSFRPIGRAGYSILVFDLAERRARDAFRAALSRYRSRPGGEADRAEAAADSAGGDAAGGKVAPRPAPTPPIARAAIASQGRVEPVARGELPAGAIPAPGEVEADLAGRHELAHAVGVDEILAYLGPGQAVGRSMAGAAGRASLGGFHAEEGGLSGRIEPGAGNAQPQHQAGPVRHREARVVAERKDRLGAKQGAGANAGIAREEPARRILRDPRQHLPPPRVLRGVDGQPVAAHGDRPGIGLQVVGRTLQEIRRPQIARVEKGNEPAISPLADAAIASGGGPPGGLPQKTRVDAWIGPRQPLLDALGSLVGRPIVDNDQAFWGPCLLCHGNQRVQDDRSVVVDGNDDRRVGHLHGTPPGAGSPPLPLIGQGGGCCESIAAAAQELPGLPSWRTRQKRSRRGAGLQPVISRRRSGGGEGGRAGHGGNSGCRNRGHRLRSAPSSAGTLRIDSCPVCATDFGDVFRNLCGDAQ
ncbi:MAG: hypothetical protein QM844_04865, partial [Planctomycetota bacterium]|nr:hypothetical protein [Planctomycetota bacterium]